MNGTDFIDYKNCIDTNYESLVKNSRPVTLTEESMSTEEDRLTLESCVDELTNILGPSVERRLMVESLRKHRLDFELALDEILRWQSTKGRPDVQSEPLSRGNPSSEHLSDDSGGPSFMFERRPPYYDEEDVADYLGFAQVGGRRDESRQTHDVVEKTLENYCSSRTSSPETWEDHFQRLELEVPEIEGGFNDFRREWTRVLGEILVKPQSKFDKRRASRRLKQNDEIANAGLSYQRLSHQIRYDKVKAKLRKPRHDLSSDVFTQKQETLKPRGEIELAVVAPNDVLPEKLVCKTNSSTLTNQFSAFSAEVASMEEYMTTFWTKGLRNLRRNRIRTDKKVPQLHKIKCKSSKVENSLLTYSRLSHLLRLSIGRESRDAPLPSNEIETSSDSPSIQVKPSTTIARPPKHDDCDLSFLNDDLKSVTVALAQKKPKNGPNYFAQGARPKLFSPADTAQRSITATPPYASLQPNEPVKCLKDNRSVENIVPLSSPTMEKPMKSPSPSPLSRLGRGVSLQQLARNHEIERQTRSQSPNPRLGDGNPTKTSRLGSPLSGFRQLSKASSNWESATSSNSAKCPQKPSLSSLSSLAKAHSDATSGSLLQSLQTLNLAHITSDSDSHLGTVFKLPGFETVLVDKSVDEKRDAVSMLEVGSVAERVESSTSGRRFLYRHQRNENRKKGKRPKRLKGTLVSFDFSIASPDDLVLEKQKMAFERSEPAMSRSTPLDRNNSTTPPRTSSTPTSGAVKSESILVPTDKANKGLELKGSAKQAPDNWESHSICG